MVSCQKVTDELTNLLDEKVSPELRAEIEHHLKYCRRCSVLLDSVRKVLVITGDERTFEVPLGFDERLHTYLAQKIAKASK